MENDPWKHRSKGMKCSTCMWNLAKKNEKDEEVLGRCRRHSPTMNGYPAVFPNDWCGDHKLDENKMETPMVFPPLRDSLDVKVRPGDALVI